MIFLKAYGDKYFLKHIFYILNDLNELDLSGIMAVESPH